MMKKIPEEKDNNIQFQIAKVETLQFAILQEELNENALKLQAIFSFGVDEDTLMLRCSFDYSLLSEEKQVLKIEAAVLFSIEPNCFKTKIEKENSWVIPAGFAQHMAITTVGVTRGILHEKTKTSLLNKFPIPAINVLDTVKNDVIIESVRKEKKSTV